jgi:hypothetical protein
MKNEYKMTIIGEAQKAVSEIETQRGIKIACEKHAENIVLKTLQTEVWISEKKIIIESGDLFKINTLINAAFVPQSTEKQLKEQLRIAKKETEILRKKLNEAKNENEILKEKLAVAKLAIEQLKNQQNGE